MTTLREMRDQLVDMDDPGKVLHLADKYLADMELKGADFILPSAHSFIKPILEHYYGDLPGWIKFVKGVRDILMNARLDYSEVQKLYRTIDLRLTQKIRRERLNTAVEMAILAGKIDNDTASKRRYANRCTQEWMKLKTLMLQNLRAKTGTGRVSREEMDTALEEFWNGIDAGIASGDLPEA